MNHKKVIDHLLPYYYAGYRGVTLQKTRWHTRINCCYDDYDFDECEECAIGTQCNLYAQFEFADTKICSYHYFTLINIFQKHAEQYALTLQVIRGMSIDDVCGCIVAAYRDLVVGEIITLLPEIVDSDYESFTSSDELDDELDEAIHDGFTSSESDDVSDEVLRNY